MIFAVIWHSTLLGSYSCGVDAAETARRFPGATVTECRLNSETVHGAQMLAPDPQLAQPSSAASESAARFSVGVAVSSRTRLSDGSASG